MTKQNNTLYTRRQFLKAGSITALSTNAACRNINPAHSSQVIVIGAGLAGLNCALALQNQGYDVVVLEANQQVGGRTRSINKNGTTINLGGIEIGDGYQRFVGLCEQYKLNLYEPKRASRDLCVHIGGQLISQDDWATAKANPLPEHLKATLPSRLQSHFHRGKNPLKSKTDWIEGQHLTSDQSEIEFLKEQGAGDAAIEFINHTGNFNSVETVAALHYQRAIANFRFGTTKKTLRLSGGNQSLARSMANSVNALHTGQRAQSIEQTSNGVTVRTDQAEWLGQHCVIALPFSVLRNIPLVAPLSDAQRNAINELPYTKISKLVLAVEKPFWEEDGFGPNLWSDTSLERGFLSYSEKGDLLYTLFVNGRNAQQLDRLSDEDATKTLIDLLNTSRPSTKNALRPLAYYSWGNDPFALGAYHHFAPNQVSSFARSMTQAAGRIHFAGEHCARANQGMEGALESGEFTARQLIQTS